MRLTTRQTHRLLKRPRRLRYSIGGANFSRPNVRSASLGRAFGGSSSVDPRRRTTGPSSLSRALLSPAILRENVLQSMP
jgi:hypothetical protein